jgi:hypothetical protein
MRCITKIHKMLTVLMSCSLLYHNLTTKPWIWFFIVKLKSTIIKITLNQYIVEKGLGLSLKLGLELGLGFKLSLLSPINIALFVCCLFFHSKNSVFSLRFHHLLTLFFYFLCNCVILQMYVFAIVSFVKCYFICLLSNSFW